MASFDESKVKEIIAKELEVDVKQLTPEAKFIEDLGA
jgi:acyl carrier protein